MALVAPVAAEPFTVEHFRDWAAQLELDNGKPWVVDDFFAAFLEDYFAGIPECWLIVPEGNGKTTSLAGLAVYLLEHRRGAWIPWAAASRDQAELGYRQADGFIKRSNRLLPLFKRLEGYRRIVHKLNSNRLQIFAADEATGDGLIATDSFIDELHRHKDLGLYRTWSGKSEKREGQLATISIAGEPSGEFELTRERIRQETPVIERRPGYVHCRSSAIALHEYAVPEDGDVTDMAVVKTANPSPRITEATLAAKYATPTMTLPHWKRFRCNQPTRGEDAAVTEAEWETAKVNPGKGEPVEIPEGEPIDVGIDPAWKLDTFAIVPLWLRDEHFGLFGPAAVTVPPRDGTSIHPDVPMVALTKIHERNPIRTVVMDTSASVDFAHRIETDLGVVVVDRPQTNPLAEHDYAVFMAWLRNHWLKHTGDEDLTRQVLNAIARELPGGGFRFDRPHRSRTGNQAMRVIDALSAASMVLAFATADTVEEEAPTPFVLFGGGS